ncbi:hypothetical protein GCM10010341_67080 [Streptomyces noursei]|nr:hypothetical protein GCM10010341_67080 [Streptomyces noursei]
MNVSVVLFTADLRLTDHPPLRAALDAADAVVPLFVRDRAVEATGFVAPNRRAFLDGCLADLDARLRERGGRLVVRSGDLVQEVCRVVTETDAEEVHMAAGHSRFAARREERLRSALEAAGRHLRPPLGPRTRRTGTPVGARALETARCGPSRPRPIGQALVLQRCLV